MPSRLAVPPPLLDEPFTRAEALRFIGPDTLRGPSYQRLLRGVHRTAGELTHLDRILAARRVLPGDAVLAGLSALWALGVELATASTPAEAIVPALSGARNRTHLRVSRAVLGHGEVAVLDLGPTTTPARTAFDLARSGEPIDAVPLLDALVRQTGVTRAQILEVTAVHPRARWLSRVDRALDLVDQRSESVRESQLRVACAEFGLAKPVPQFVIRARNGEFVARVDLAWPELLVALEYDGAHHDEREQILRDRARANAIRAAGWTLLAVDARQFARRVEMLEMIRGVLRAAESRA